MIPIIALWVSVAFTPCPRFSNCRFGEMLMSIIPKLFLSFLMHWLLLEDALVAIGRCNHFMINGCMCCLRLLPFGFGWDSIGFHVMWDPFNYFINKLYYIANILTPCVMGPASFIYFFDFSKVNFNGMI